MWYPSRFSMDVAQLAVLEAANTAFSN